MWWEVSRHLSPLLELDLLLYIASDAEQGQNRVLSACPPCEARTGMWDWGRQSIHFFCSQIHPGSITSDQTSFLSLSLLIYEVKDEKSYLMEYCNA